MSTKASVEQAYTTYKKGVGEAKSQGAKRLLGVALGIIPLVCGVLYISLFNIDLYPIAIVLAIIIIALFIWAGKKYENEIDTVASWKPTATEYLRTLNFDVETLSPTLGAYGSNPPVNLYDNPADPYLYNGKAQIDGRYTDLQIQDINGRIIFMYSGPESGK